MLSVEDRHCGTQNFKPSVSDLVRSIEKGTGVAG